MKWELYRVEEGNGFVADRIFFKCLYLCGLIYGNCARSGKQILLPQLVYSEIERYKGW